MRAKLRGVVSTASNGLGAMLAGGAVVGELATAADVGVVDGVVVCPAGPCGTEQAASNRTTTSARKAS
jgi:hypothetical protein